MKINRLILFGILILLTSCKGQPVNEKKQTEPFIEPLAPGDTVSELGNSIMVIYQDKNNIYWFGSWETGVYRYDGKTLINYTTKHGLPGNRIDEIKEDKSGNIYFNSCSPISSICKFNGHTFIPLKAISGNDWKLQSDDLWFRHSYSNEKVYRFDGIHLYELPLPKPSNLSNAFEIYSIYQDRKGSIWFGTNPSGVCRYNGKSFEWITEEDVTEFRNEGANGVRSIIEDKEGDFWFNTEFRYHVYDSVSANNNKFYQRQESLGSLDGRKDSRINEYLSIVKDNHENLWMATYRHGVWKYDGTKVTHYPVQLNAKDINVFSLFKDNKGELWLGTHQNGAFKFNGTSFEKFSL